ncbi:hypothetical protein SS50377_28308 [Spironucleus salmonicida]|uniref:Transmembrane protein n=1 Tax=Spironucleus salmonicida TaxID=348837 RepID=A0A9P8LLG7_9EUKA|nr:hypothetical protein SS50377_28308 [Spironucleus salmonicida]
MYDFNQSKMNQISIYTFIFLTYSYLIANYIHIPLAIKLSYNFQNQIYYRTKNYSSLYQKFSICQHHTITYQQIPSNIFKKNIPSANRISFASRSYWILSYITLNRLYIAKRYNESDQFILQDFQSNTFTFICFKRRFLMNLKLLKSVSIIIFSEFLFSFKIIQNHNGDKIDLDIFNV